MKHAGVQAHDVSWAAIPTMERPGTTTTTPSPARPASASIPAKATAGFRFIQLLERLGLAWDVRTPEAAL